jgi:Tfp pilus assembly protein PilO
MHADIESKINIYLIPFSALAVSLCLAAVTLHFAITPWVQGIARDRATIANLRQVIETESGSAIIVKEIQAKQARLQEKMSSLTSNFVDPSDLSGLLQMIFDKAWKANIKFDKTQPQPEIRGEDFILYPIVFEMTTTYNAFGHFISELEKMPQVVRIDRVALDAVAGGKVEAKIMLSCFLRSPQKQEGQ